MEYIENSYLDTLPTIPLLIAVIVTVATSYILAFIYRKTYDPKVLIKKYAIYFLPFTVVFTLLGVKLILLVGIYLLGAIVLLFRSNHYFYRDK